MGKIMKKRTITRELMTAIRNKWLAPGRPFRHGRDRPASSGSCFNQCEKFCCRFAAAAAS
jgi:hypothetical protein